MLNGKRVLSLVEMISSYHRSRGSKGYKGSLDELERHLLGSGIKKGSIKRKKYKTGKINGGAFDIPEIWDPVEGDLWMVKPERQYITSTKRVKLALAFGSASSNGVETLELVDYTGPGDYTKKAVLTDKGPNEIFEEAVIKGGARCIVFSVMRVNSELLGRTPELLPEMTSFPGTDQTIDGTSYDVYAFSISPARHKFLKEKLSNGKVYVEAKAEAEVGHGAFDVMEVTLPGDGRKDYLLLTAHICHPAPGANDNASGAALAAELAVILNKLKLSLPIRIAFVPEYYGSVPYSIELKKHGDLPFYVINLDMVGEDQEKTSATLILGESSPFVFQRYDSVLNHYLNAEIPTVACHPIRRFYRSPYSAGSDHCAFSPFGIPAACVGHFPDRYYHSDMDTPDKCDPGTFEWIGNAVLETIKYIDTPSNKIEAEIKSAMAGGYVKHMEKIKELSGGKEAMLVLNKVFEAEKSGLDRLYNPEEYIQSEFPISANFESSIGLDWKKELDIELNQVTMDSLSSVAEVINIGVNVTGVKEATEVLTAAHLDVPLEDVKKLVDYFIRKGFYTV